ncbi:MAG: hypothetical protein CL669_01205 [Balneola sp.]|nr:hypothetical protein [Balneola sp.]|tara:strand:- start:665 stop:877 length:213 start_codon:yes stop_codon:yes gene_type:complete
MLFGLPWFAVIAIVAIGGGMIFSYKEKELALEEKNLFNVREAYELREDIERLQRRIEHLESKVIKKSSDE